jgi:hypothetical protein
MPRFGDPLSTSERLGTYQPGEKFSNRTILFLQAPLAVGYRKVYSGRREADVVMSSVSSD